MIENVKFSVLITTHAARYSAAEKALRGWLAQPADEIWILDGGGEFKPWPATPADPRLSIFRMPFDLGPKMDYAMALLTEGDLICLADDDLIPSPGFLEDLFAGWKQVGGGIVGVIGRTFEGAKYHGETTFYASRKIEKPVRVGFTGVAFLTARDVFGFDVRGLPRNCDDIWMQMKKLPDVPKWVVPTTKYQNTPEASDGTAMYKNPALRTQREDFFRFEYEEKYKPEGRTF